MSDRKCSFCQQVKVEDTSSYYVISDRGSEDASYACDACWDKNKEKFKHKEVTHYWKDNTSPFFNHKRFWGKCEVSLYEWRCNGKNMAYETYWSSSSGEDAEGGEFACIPCLKHLLKKNIADLEKKSPLTPEQEQKLNKKKQKLAELLRDNPDSPNDNEDNNRDEGGGRYGNLEKQELENLIAMTQQALKAVRQIPKNHPGYNEYQKQQLEQQLTEMISRYKSKYGDLPSSLREDVGGGWKPLPKWKNYSMNSSSDRIGDCCRSNHILSTKEK